MGPRSCPMSNSLLCLHLKRLKYIEQQDRWGPQPSELLAYISSSCIRLIRCVAVIGQASGNTSCLYMIDSIRHTACQASGMTHP